MEKIYCADCGKLINGKNTNDEYCYVSGEDFFCEECGDDLFCWNDSIEEYVWEEDDRDTFYDDEISDLSMYLTCDLLVKKSGRCHIIKDTIN